MQSPAASAAVPEKRYEYRGAAAYVDRFDAQSPSTLLIDLINHFHQQSGYTGGGNATGQPDLSNINIQDLFGGAEWNAMIMDPGFRQG